MQKPMVHDLRINHLSLRSQMGLWILSTGKDLLDLCHSRSFHYFLALFYPNYRLRRTVLGLHSRKDHLLVQIDLHFLMNLDPSSQKLNPNF